MAQYLYATANHEPSPWELKGLAVACITIIILLVIFNTKVSLHLSNAVGIVKIITLLFISITGLVVLGGHTRVKQPHANFHNAFEGTTGNGYGLANALVKINFAYAGYTNAFNVVNEVKVFVVLPTAHYILIPSLESYQSSQKDCASFFVSCSTSLHAL